jgi:TolB protein
MHADLSPDRSRLVYTRPNTQALWTADIDGANEILISSYSAPQYVPHWSYDGAKIVFTREVTWGGNAREIFTMDSDGLGVTRLTSNGVMDHDGQWSPDGSQIVFFSQRDGPGDVYVMNADGSGTVRLTSGLNAGAPEFSPDGQTIAFVAAPTGDLGVYTMSARGEDVRLLFSDPCIAGSEFGVHFSPNGEFLAFSACVSETTSDVYSIRVDGSGLRRLTATPHVSELVRSWR